MPSTLTRQVDDLLLLVDPTYKVSTLKPESSNLSTTLPGFVCAETSASEIQFIDKIIPGYDTVTDVTSFFHTEETEFQQVSVIETAFGRHILCDGYTQSTERDEHIYHEAAVHPPMIAHPCPRRVFIGGGGEMATAREVLRHNVVEEVVMVDIDPKMVEIAKKWMPSYGGEQVEKDPRLKLIIGDCRAYLEEYDAKTNGTFDVMLMDICDPVPGPGLVCYFPDFYQMCRAAMSSDGIFMTQSGPCSRDTFEECFCVVHRTIEHSFGNVIGYSAEVPSYGCRWGFNMSCLDDKNPFMDVTKPGLVEKIDRVIEERGLKDDLEFYDGITHLHLFSMPKYVRDGCDAEQRVLTAENHEDVLNML